MDKNRIIVCVIFCLVGMVYCTRSGFHALILVDEFGTILALIFNNMVQVFLFAVYIKPLEELDDEI
jgi:hypothetical protein